MESEVTPEHRWGDQKEKKGESPKARKVKMAQDSLQVVRCVPAGILAPVSTAQKQLWCGQHVWGWLLPQSLIETTLLCSLPARAQSTYTAKDFTPEADLTGHERPRVSLPTTLPSPHYHKLLIIIPITISTPYYCTHHHKLITI